MWQKVLRDTSSMGYHNEREKTGHRKNNHTSDLYKPITKQVETRPRNKPVPARRSVQLSPSFTHSSSKYQQDLVINARHVQTTPPEDIFETIENAQGFTGLKQTSNQHKIGQQLTGADNLIGLEIGGEYLTLDSKRADRRKSLIVQLPDINARVVHTPYSSFIVEEELAGYLI